jgi:hypothetical protein
VGAQCLALLDALPSGAGLMAGHSWLAEAGGDAEDGGDGPVARPSLPSLAAARPQGSASATANVTPAPAAAAAAAASGSSADAAALVAAVARGQDAREAARGSVAAAGPQRQQDAGSAAGSVVAAASAAAGAAAQRAAQPQPPHQQQEAAAGAAIQGVAQPQPQHQQQHAAGPALPPRPESESIGTQADTSAAEGGAEDGPDTDAHVLRRIEHWAKLQLGLGVLSVPALMLGVWLSKRQ